MSPDTVNHSQVGNVFMLGAGGVFVVAFSAYFGRLPILFWFLVIAFATAAWCAGATGFDSFLAARVLNGFFSTVAQGVCCPTLPANVTDNLIGRPNVHQRPVLLS